MVYRVPVILSTAGMVSAANQQRRLRVLRAKPYIIRTSASRTRKLLSPVNQSSPKSKRPPSRRTPPLISSAQCQSWHRQRGRSLAAPPATNSPFAPLPPPCKSATWPTLATPPAPPPHRTRAPSEAYRTTRTRPTFLHSRSTGAVVARLVQSCSSTSWSALSVL